MCEATSISSAAFLGSCFSSQELCSYLLWSFSGGPGVFPSIPDQDVATSILLPLINVKTNGVLSPDWITPVMFFTMILCMGSLRTLMLRCVVHYRNLRLVCLQFQQVWLLLKENKTVMLTMMTLCRLLEVSLSPWWLSPWVCDLLLVILSCRILL